MEHDTEAYFTAKPVQVRAFQWKGPHQQVYPLWLDSLCRRGQVHVRDRGRKVTLRIAPTDATPVQAEIGHWIVRRGDTIMVHRPETFEKLYGLTPAVVPQYDMAMG